MDLVIGGAYQGKLDYAVETWGLEKADICDCSAEKADFSKRCLYHYELYLFDCIKEGETPRLPSRTDAIVIADDVSSGVVPMGKDERAWRELCGRTLTEIANRSESLTRLFCGIPKRLKG